MTRRLIDLHGRWIFTDLARNSDAASEAIANGEAVAGHIYGLSQDLAETHRALAVQQDVPGIDDAGHGARKEAVALRELAPGILVVPVDSGKPRRRALGVDRDHLFGASVIDEDHCVAADA